MIEQEIESKVIQLLNTEPAGMMRSAIANQIGLEYNALLTKVLFDLIDKHVVICVPQFVKDEYGDVQKPWYGRGKNWDEYTVGKIAQ